MIAPLQLGGRHERARARSQQVTNTSGRHLFVFDNGVCFDEERGTQIGTRSAQESLATLSGSVFVDVGREASGPA